MRAPSITEVLAVAVGGAAGATIRWAVAEAWTSGGFPWATFAVNVVGCLVLGAITETDRRPVTTALVGAGFAGGLTTFSTFAVELAVFLDDGRPAVAAVYLMASASAGVVAAVAGRRSFRSR